MPNASNIMIEGLVNSEISSSFIAVRQDSDRRMVRSSFFLDQRCICLAYKVFVMKEAF